MPESYVPDAAAQDEPARTMLIIGATFADAVAFIGSDIGPTEDDARAYIAASGPEKDERWPRRDDRASAKVPDRLWPAHGADGSWFTTWFRGGDFTNENGSGPYDAVIVTAAAAADINERGGVGVLAGLTRDDGWTWIDGMGEAGTMRRAEKGERRVFFIGGKLVAFTAGEYVKVATPDQAAVARALAATEGEAAILSAIERAPTP